jgi:tRNA uridine 5-carboxymethylaminomethyl modification enzyme
LRASEGLGLPATLDYAAVPGLSNEMTERLLAARPATLGAAGRSPGSHPQRSRFCWSTRASTPSHDIKQ